MQKLVVNIRSFTFIAFLVVLMTLAYVSYQLYISIPRPPEPINNNTAVLERYLSIFDSTDISQNIYSTGLNMQYEKMLSLGEMMAQNPSISPDGTKLAFFNEKYIEGSPPIFEFLLYDILNDTLIKSNDSFDHLSLIFWFDNSTIYTAYADKVLITNISDLTFAKSVFDIEDSFATGITYIPKSDKFVISTAEILRDFNWGENSVEYIKENSSRTVLKVFNPDGSLYTQLDTSVKPRMNNITLYPEPVKLSTGSNHLYLPYSNLKWVFNNENFPVTEDFFPYGYIMDNEKYIYTFEADNSKINIYNKYNEYVRSIEKKGLHEFNVDEENFIEAFPLKNSNEIIIVSECYIMGEPNFKIFTRYNPDTEKAYVITTTPSTYVPAGITNDYKIVLMGEVIYPENMGLPIIPLPVPQLIDYNVSFKIPEKAYGNGVPSPNREKLIAFYQTEDNSQLSLFELNGKNGNLIKEIEPFLENSAKIEQIGWLNNEHIFVASKFQLWVMNINTDQKKLLTPDIPDAEEENPLDWWAKDVHVGNGYLFYNSVRDDVTAIYTATLNSETIYATDAYLIDAYPDNSVLYYTSDNDLYLNSEKIYSYSPAEEMDFKNAYFDGENVYYSLTVTMKQKTVNYKCVYNMYSKITQAYEKYQ